MPNISEYGALDKPKQESAGTVRNLPPPRCDFVFCVPKVKETSEAPSTVTQHPSDPLNFRADKESLGGHWLAQHSTTSPGVPKEKGQRLMYRGRQFTP